MLQLWLLLSMSMLMLSCSIYSISVSQSEKESERKDSNKFECMRLMETARQLDCLAARRIVSVQQLSEKEYNKNSLNQRSLAHF